MNAPHWFSWSFPRSKWASQRATGLHLSYRWCNGDVSPNRWNRKHHPKNKHTHTHTHKSQIASVFGCSWIMWSTTLILGSQKASWFQHLVDRCRLINAKVQEVGQLHFQLQEALAKVVGPSVFVGQWWCGKNRMVMSCVKQRRDKENKIG